MRDKRQRVNSCVLASVAHIIPPLLPLHPVQNFFLEPDSCSSTKAPLQSRATASMRSPFFVVFGIAWEREERGGGR